jgi:hypothetical protein
MGYETMRPSRLQVGSRLFLPDITATKDGETIYAEVERNTPRRAGIEIKSGAISSTSQTAECIYFYEGDKAQYQALTRLALWS